MEERLIIRKIMKHIDEQGICDGSVGNYDVYAITEDDNVKYYRGTSLINIITLGLAKIFALPEIYITCEREELSEKIAFELGDGVSITKFHQSYVDKGTYI
jgi:hypothetical protein